MGALTLALSLLEGLGLPMLRQLTTFPEKRFHTMFNLMFVFLRLLILF